jgi:parallel beta-helix repeat protein
VDGTSYVNVSGFTVKNGTFGFHLNNSNHCIVENNSVSNNNLGINITQSTDINIEYNTVSNNNRALVADNSTLIVQYNNISYNTEGIDAICYSDAFIGNNTITHNAGSGIRKMVCSNGTIDNNTISHNYYGIDIGESSPTITYNNITLNTIGIYCFYGSNATIHWNNINNTVFNLINVDPSINISAENNWWGSNPPDWSKIQGEVDAVPWETEAIEEAGPQ